MESPTEPVNFGRSLLVPSVQELAKHHVSHIPPRYVRTIQVPPSVSGADLHLQTVPVIDLQSLIRDGDLIDSELEKLHSACRSWGFFQVVNHGVSTLLLESFKLAIARFFSLSLEDKKKLWQQPDNHEGFGQLFVVSEEQKLDWSDMFYITTLPVNLRQTDLFQKLPNYLRETLVEYSNEVKKLAIALLKQMSKALNMDENQMNELFCEGVQSMRMNYYPPCPEPQMAMGFSPHSDADALTILYQLNDTEGLQIQKDGQWIMVQPLPNAFVINIGDILEIVSNGIYKSIEHRATVNQTKERLSVATFYSCKLDAELGPAPSLITEQNPAIFKTFPVEEYFKGFFARKLNGKSYLHSMKIDNNDD